MQQIPKQRLSWHGQGFFFVMGCILGIGLSVLLIGNPVHSGIGLAVGIGLGSVFELFAYFDNKRKAR